MKNILFATIFYKPLNINSYFECFLKNEKAELLIISNEESWKDKFDFNNNIPIISNHRNAGFAIAANQAINYAIENNFNYLCLFNQDVKLNPKDIEQLLPYFIQYPDLVIISPFHLKNESETEYYFNDILKKNKIQFPYNSFYFVPFVHAACWIIDLTKIREIGGFNPIFFIYGEDLNLCHRIEHAGYKIGIVPKVTIIHSKIDREYDFDINKKKKANATFQLCKALNPANPKKISVLILESMFLSLKCFITFNWKQSYIHSYACVYLIYKVSQLKMQY